MSDLSSSAPGRVELLGNHTDYNEGVVLSCAINYGVRAHGGKRSGGEIELRSELNSAPVCLAVSEVAPLTGQASWANYPLGVVQVLRAAGHGVEGFAASFTSDLPAGAGLSSSAALEVATAVLLCKIFALDISPLDVAKLCRKAENDFVGVQCGLLDQVSSVFGKAGHAVYLDCRSETVETIALPHGLALLVFHSGVPHRLVGGEYNERRAQCFMAARELGVKALRDVSGAQLAAARGSLDSLVYRRAAHIVGENARVLAGIEFLRAGDGGAFGSLMFESHESSRLDFENSSPELDVLVEIAHEIPGVLGSRLTGGGFGGATISLVEAGFLETAARRMDTEYTRRTGNRGHAYPCESADGAS